MDGNGYNFALSDRSAVKRILLLTFVQGGHHAHMGQQQGQLKYFYMINFMIETKMLIYLLTHVNDSTWCEDPEDEEEDKGDGKENNDET